jgi:hypothetical protein
MNVETVDRILSDALMALGAAQAELRKNATQSELGDVLRKSDLTDYPPRASRSDDALTRTLEALANAERRTSTLESARDLDAQTARKTYTIGVA